jgi:hypothetical protein
MREAPFNDFNKAPVNKGPIDKALFIDDSESEEEDLPSFWFDDDDFEMKSESYSCFFWGLITTAMSVAIIIKQAINY